MNKTKNILLIIAGGFNTFFLAFHLLFYRLFNWQESLACLNRSDWAIFLTYHLICLLMLAAMAYFSFFRRRGLAQEGLGKPLLVFFALFYLVRIAAEFVYFGYSGLESLVIVALCLVPALIYAYVLLPVKG